MSGICGIINYREWTSHDQQRDRKRLMEALQHRDVRGRQVFQSSNSFLCQFNSSWTRENSADPFILEMRKRFDVILHGVLSNREHLHKSCRLKLPLSTYSDEDLILSSYMEYGSKTPEKVEGDFVFSIWDNTSRELFCARDHIGTRPFYYFFDNQRVVFAPEIRGILPFISKKDINATRLAEFFTLYINDNESTFYRNIFRLPSGHSLFFHPQEMRKKKYYQLTPADTGECISGPEQIFHFSDLWKKSIKKYVKPACTTGALLSGGLDSSAIVCSLLNDFKEIQPPLHILSGSFRYLKECDEQDYIDAVLTKYKREGHQIPIDTVSVFEAYNNLESIAEEPFWSPNYSMLYAILQKAEKLNIAILFTGDDGDTAISHGWGYIKDLILKKKYFKLLYQCLYLGDNPSILHSLRIFKRMVQASIHPQFQQTDFIKRYTNQREEVSRLLNDEFIKKSRLKEKIHQTIDRIESIHLDNYEQKRHFLAITNPLHQDFLEYLDKISQWRKVDLAYPFYDKKVIELCINLPGEMKFSRGLNRLIVRKSLKEILPDKISRRKSKTIFNRNVLSGFLEKEKETLLKELARIDPDIFSVVNATYVEEISARLKKGTSLELDDLNFILKCISFSNWLKK